MKKALLALTLVLAIPLTAQATPVTLTATNGSNLSASVTFVDLGGGSLQITLTNISLVDVTNPSGVLTALFFELTGAALTPVSALLGSGSTVLFDPDGQPAGGVVGGEWAYAAGLSGAPGGATSGISSAGFGLFGGATFPGPDLSPPTAVNGLNYGITSAGDNPLTGNAAVTGGFPLIQSSVVFTLNYTGTLDLSQLSNVSFQYGTALGEPNISVPDGGMTISLLGLALAGMGLVARRKK